MDSFPAHVVAAIATVTAAFFAGGVAFLVAVLSKEQKTSEFRQQWIDALRTDIADLVGEFSILFMVGDRTRGQDQQVVEKQIDARYANLVKTRSLIARIELRINPDEHKTFVNALTVIQETSVVTDDIAVREQKVQTLIQESQLLLKKEWKRVKRGELTFVATKVIAGAFVFAAAIFGAITVYQSLYASTATSSAERPPPPQAADSSLQLRPSRAYRAQ